MSCFHGMRFAAVLVTVTYLSVITMQKNQDTPKEVIVLEVIVWLFLLLFFAVSYRLV
jgi:hypothetical protein